MKTVANISPLIKPPRGRVKQLIFSSDELALADAGGCADVDALILNSKQSCLMPSPNQSPSSGIFRQRGFVLWGVVVLKRNSDLVFSVFIRSIGSMGMYIKHNKNRKHKTTTKKKDAFLSSWFSLWWCLRFLLLDQQQPTTTPQSKSKCCWFPHHHPPSSSTATAP